MGNPRTQSNEELHAAARAGDLTAVQRICSSNPLAVNSRDKHSRTPLHLAAWSGHAQIVSYLCKNKADARAAAMDDMGAIHFAAQKGHLEAVRVLLTSGVSVNSTNRKGMSALHYASQGSNLELVKYLVKKCASVSVKNKAGKTPLDLARNEDIRSFLRDCETTSVGAALGSGEDGDETKSKPSSAVENEEGPEVSADEEGEHFKRKAEGEENSKKETKKPKVALYHLLTSDDVEEEVENL
ncbi:unnamed protein product [Cuscuta campestris]|uniref:Uncharacterized protein n=1 Tax=Cuscuta campestris TaxID=132261 RepID=A0A484N8M3_9ASTE|nr:unnamed protein product [Cuscuta campestris]